MKRRRFNIGRVVLAIILLSWLVGCLGSSGIQTMVHRSSQSVVYLDWVPQESFRASHPVTLSPMTIRRFFGGVRVQTSPGILKALLGEKGRPSRLFSEDDVELLLPHILSAFSQVTSEEHVVFQTLDPSDAAGVMIAGTLHIHEGLLFLTLTHYDRKTTYPTITVYKGNRELSDPTGLKDVQVSFSPKAAWRTEGVPKLDTGGGNDPKRTLAVDYARLAQLSDTVLPIPRDEAPISNSAPSSVETLGDEQTKGKELQGLKERMRSLRDQLSNMEKKIEGLEEQPSSNP
ncbi:MAG: hypothetical protein GKS05_10915 [Nitrospirales bacterium]|nr:hypothetical protein [Nitrospirales bacterium]